MHLTLQLILRQLEKLKRNFALQGKIIYLYFSCDLVSDRKLAQETTFYNSYYKLPDGRTIQIGKEKFEAPEILFNPMQIGMEGDGAAELVFKSINVKFSLNKDLSHGYKKSSL